MELSRNGTPRVVITGMAVLSPLGKLQQMWEGLKEGRSGISLIESFDLSDFPVHIAGEIKDFNPADYGLGRKEARRMARSSQFVIATTKLLMEDAGLTKEAIAPEADRVAVVVGSGMAGHEMATRATLEYMARGRKRASPYGLVASMINAPAFYVSHETGAVGHIVVPSTACATGTQSIGEAAELIRHGRADMAIAGGVEALIQDYAIAGFDATGAVTRDYNDRPEAASRPFDGRRSGLVFSEGCGLVLLESLEHALARDARIYAEVLGYGASSDAYHIAAPDPEGKGAALAIRRALEDARISVDEIDYINAHATSTIAGDIAETKAVKLAFGPRAYDLPISAPKSMLGHMMGAGGAVETIACVMSLLDGVIHPTINQEYPDPECDLDYVPNRARDAKLNTVLKNSFGLGGINACLVIGKVR